MPQIPKMLIRRATIQDQPQLLLLARGERIKPIGLNWKRFIVADVDGTLIGAVQLRQHPDGSKELGSLVVAALYRRRGVAARLIEEHLRDMKGRVHIITARAHAAYYARWGFCPISVRQAPLCVWLN